MATPVMIIMHNVKMRNMRSTKFINFVQGHIINKTWKQE